MPARYNPLTQFPPTQLSGPLFEGDRCRRCNCRTRTHEGTVCLSHRLFCVEGRLATTEEMDRIWARRAGQAYVPPAGKLDRAVRWVYRVTGANDDPALMGGEPASAEGHQ
jgi:hypothetical protein